jgi:hypothetical protein
VSGFTLAPKWVAWVPAASLTVVLLATFFPWVGSYPGGIRVYSQTPWQALSADISVTSLPTELLAEETAIKERLGTSWWLLAYLPLLLVAVALAWAERFVPTPDRDKLPNGMEWLADYWNYRLFVLVGLSAFLLALIEMQLLTGFGLDAAVRDLAADEATRVGVPEEVQRQNPQATQGEKELAVESALKDGVKFTSRPMEDKFDVLTGRRVGSFAMSGTTARDVAILAHLLAVFALVVRIWLDRRGNRPPPRFEVRH